MNDHAPSIPVYNEEDPFVFISYCHRNEEQAFRVIRLLYENGYRVWYDNGLITGSQYNDVIARKIDACTGFFCLLTREYAQSENCSKELSYAIGDLHKPHVFPIYLQDPYSVKKHLTPGNQMLLSDLHYDRLLPEESSEPLLQVLRQSKALQLCLDQNRINNAEELYQNGLTHWVQDEFREAKPLLLSAAEKGHVKASALLGEMYLTGKGSSVNPEAAAPFLTYAAEEHDARAQYFYAEYLFVHVPGKEKDAVSWYTKAAQNGRPEAAFRLGLLNMDGQYVVRNLPAAMEWFLKAAAGGCADAEYQLGIMYKNGFGVKSDMQEARNWFQKAAGHGHAKAGKEL